MIFFSAIFFCFINPAITWAEVILKDVEWQISVTEPKGKGKYHPIKQWDRPPSSKQTPKIHAKVTLINRGPQPARGVLLRYSVSGRQAKITELQDEGAWIVPYWVEERRVPFIPANQIKEIPIDLRRLSDFLKDAYSIQYWPKEIKLQIMIVPRSGEDLQQRLLEKTIPVLWSIQELKNP